MSSMLFIFFMLKCVCTFNDFPFFGGVCLILNECIFFKGKTVWFFSCENKMRKS